MSDKHTLVLITKGPVAVSAVPVAAVTVKSPSVLSVVLQNKLYFFKSKSSAPTANPDVIV